MESFNKIIGYESVKKELYQIIDMFRNSHLYEQMGARLPKGILLIGEPGVGKSLLCNAVIEECNVPSYKITNNKDQKECINSINEAFNDAGKNETAIVFFDDIDKLSESDEENVDDRVFAAIQSGIDSVKAKNVLVLATANNERKLPKSLKRAGRFDRRIVLEPPTNEDGRKIIEYYLSSKQVSKDLDYNDLSKMISYSSCAELETLLNEGAIYATYARKEYIDMEDIIKAYINEKYIITDDSLSCSQEEIQATAIHECGHLLVAESIKKGCVGFVSIQTVDKGVIEGFTHLCEDLNRRPENILVALAGKAAVELYHQGRCASGCQSDLHKASALLRDGILKNATMGIGMLDVGGGVFPNLSETFSFQNESLVRAELEKYLFMAKDILIKNRDLLFALVEKIKEKNYLLYSEIQQIESQFGIKTIQIN